MEKVKQQLDEEAQDSMQSPEELESKPWFKTWGFHSAYGLGVAVLIGIVIWHYSDFLSLDYLASKEGDLQAFEDEHPLMLYGIVFTLYVIGFAIGLPLAAVMTIIVGWFFDFFLALLLVSFGSTAGAVLPFLLSRYFFRDRMQQWLQGTMQKFHDELHKDVAFYLFISRLIPQIPFVVVNLVMGLSKIKLRTFWWVSQLSMLPILIVYVWIGGSLPSLQTIADKDISSVLSWQLMLGISLLGLIPLLIRLALNYYQSDGEDEEEVAEPA